MGLYHGSQCLTESACFDDILLIICRQSAETPAAARYLPQHLPWFALFEPLFPALTTREIRAIGPQALPVAREVRAYDLFGQLHAHSAYFIRVFDSRFDGRKRRALAASRPSEVGKAIENARRQSRGLRPRFARHRGRAAHDAHIHARAHRRATGAPKTTGSPRDVQASRTKLFERAVKIDFSPGVAIRS